MAIPKVSRFSMKTAGSIRRKSGDGEYIHYLRECADNGDADARCVLGYHLDMGDCGIHDEAAAEEYLRNYAAASDPDALAFAGRYFWKHEKSKEAYRCFNETAIMRNLYGEECYIYGRLLELWNIGDTQALKYYKMAKTPEAKRFIRAIELNDRAADFLSRKQYAEGAELLSESLKEAELRNALLNFGILELEHNGNRSAGIRYLRLAAEKNHPEALKRLISLYEKENDAEAVCRLADIGRQRMKDSLECIENYTEKLDRKLKTDTVEALELLEQSAMNTVPRMTLEIRNEIRKLQDRMMEGTHELMKRIDKEGELLLESFYRISRNGSADRKELEKYADALERRMDDLTALSKKMEENLMNAVLHDDGDEIMLTKRSFTRIGERMEVLYGNGWRHMTERARCSVVTALMLFERYNEAQCNSVSDMNFNFLAIPLTSALEMEMKSKLYERYIQYCTDIIGPFENHKHLWPKELIYFKNKQPTALNFKFTLGKFMESYVKSANFRKFLKEIYGMDENVLTALSQRVDQVNTTRISSAHWNASYADARQCALEIIGLTDSDQKPITAKLPLLQIIGALHG